jgi:peroxiredoxin
MQRLIIIILACLLSQLQLQAQGYQISVQLKQYKSGQLYLAHYMGNNKYMSDSAVLNEQGIAVLKGKELLPGGIYLVLLPGKQRYFEILLDRKQQQFSIVADTSDLVTKTVFKNSPENDLFIGYNKFLTQEIGPLNTELQAKNAAKDTAAARAIETNLRKKLQDYRNDVMTKHPQSLLSSMFKGLKEPEIPAKPANEDSTFAYRYYKAHYWESIDLTDERLVYTPILDNKLNRYFTQLVPPHPDSVNIEADAIIAKTRKNKEVFKYVVWWLTYHYETSQYMGMDAVFVHLVEKYYVGGDAFWLNDEQLNKIISRAYTIAPNLIGQQAPPLEVKDSALKPISLYTTKGKYTVLVFWDPTCGHCKIEVPRLDSAYQASWKSKGVTMIGFKTEGTRDEWRSFIKEHKMSGWIHAWDPDAQSNFRRLYDVYSTPVVYLLDEKKKIIAKRIGVEQLGEVIDKLEQRNGTAQK